MEDEQTNLVGNVLTTLPELRKEWLEGSWDTEPTTYPIVNTLDELKQQVDVLVASGRGSYSVGMTITVNDNLKTIYSL